MTFDLVRKIGCYKISNLELKDPMSVSLSIALKTFKFLPLFVILLEQSTLAIPEADSRGQYHSAQTGEIEEKLLTDKIQSNNWSKIHFLSRLNSKILGGGGVEHLQIPKFAFFIHTDELD